MTALLRPVNLIVSHRHMLAATTWNDLRARFAGSVLGLAWLFLYPLLLLATYAVVYIFIFKVRLANTYGPFEYVTMIFCGLIPFIGFSEALATGVTSVTGNTSLIKNTLFPIDLLPVKTVLTSQATQLVGMGLLLIALLFLQRLGAACIWVIPIWAAQVLFTIGLVWILSSVNVFMRDLQSVISVAIMVLMMLSPIAYTEDMIPEGLRPLLKLNPLYYLIMSYRSCLMDGQAPAAEIVLPLFGLALGLFFVGYLFFFQMKKVFVDNV